MTLQDVLDNIKMSNNIKQWPDEYRIYSPRGFSLVYCNKMGQVTSFLTNLDGAVYNLTDAEQKQLQSALELRMQQLNIKSIYQAPQKQK